MKYSVGIYPAGYPSRPLCGGRGLKSYATVTVIYSLLVAPCAGGVG